jgi:hypothetical protein
MRYAVALPCKATGRSLILLIMIISAGPVTTYAQDFFPQQKDNAITIGVATILPGQNLSDNYRSGFNINAGYSRYIKRFTFSANIAYDKLWAKHGVVINRTDPTDVSYTITSPYQTYLGYISGTYNLLETGKTSVYAGFNIGGQFQKPIIVIIKG